MGKFTSLWVWSEWQLNFSVKWHFDDCVKLYKLQAAKLWFRHCKLARDQHTTVLLHVENVAKETLDQVLKFLKDVAPANLQNFLVPHPSLYHAAPTMIKRHNAFVSISNLNLYHQYAKNKRPHFIASKTRLKNYIWHNWEIHPIGNLTKIVL